MEERDRNKTYLVTGGAGFIGFFLAKRLLEEGARVIALDNLNDYYEVSLKESRLAVLRAFPSFTFERADLADKEAVFSAFERFHPDIVVNLAAQAGVRYSMENPDAYVSSNLVGFFHILEACRHYQPQHLVYASSSSVYGGNEKVPFSTDDPVDCPVSLYAATKKSNELMAYAYSKLYRIPATGLRFFTVYGPMGRPDMAYFKFARRILAGEPIAVYNYGDMLRDFTYIDDIVTGICRLLNAPPAEDGKGARAKIYNIGNNRPEKLTDLIEILERLLGREAVREYYPMQPGDVYQTYADVSDLERDFGFRPDTPLEEGLARFVEWFLPYEKQRGGLHSV